jgi:hypothetical protein
MQNGMHSASSLLLLGSISDKDDDISENRYGELLDNRETQ